MADSPETKKAYADYFSEKKLRRLALRYLDPSKVPAKIRIITDTSDFFKVDYDDVVILDGHPYLVRHNKKEGRFGIDEEPKFWVKSAIDLFDGTKKVMKLVFHERFKARVGGLVFECVRSPAKEARVLDVVQRHPNFMTGFSVKDSAGNIVRIISHIYGKTIADYALHPRKHHEKYFYTSFPEILEGFIEAAKAIRFLHGNNEIHGDIRRDHLMVDRETGKFRWIDFDFVYSHRENKFGYDMFGLGNILGYITGGGDVTVQQLREEIPDVFSKISSEDLNIIFHHRVMNLKKVFPYIPERLNNMLLHFSTGAEVFYDYAEEFLDDLMEVKNSLKIR